MKHALSLTAAAMLAACATIPPATPSPTAALGQWASVGNIKVRPTRLVEDSRCPVGVQCVWAGRLVIEADVASADGRAVRQLTLGQPATDEAPSLVAVTPPRTAQGKPAAADYRFTFALDRP